MHKKPNVFITGSSGYLGGRLTRHLDSLGITVIPSSRRSSTFSLDKGKIESKPLNLDNLKELTTLLVGSDVVLHLAATDFLTSRNNPKLAQKVNVEGTRNLIKACNEAGVKKFIYFSTCHVYGPLKGYLNEEASERPQTVYAETHLIAEEISKNDFNGESINLRLSNVVGAPLFKECGAWKLLAHDLVLSALRENKIILKTKGTQFRNFLPLRDLEKAVSFLINSNFSGSLNVANESNLSIFDMATLVQQQISEKLNKNIEIIRGTNEEEITSFEICTKKLKELSIELNGNLATEIEEIIEFASKSFTFS